jgi:hypothetical protein
VQSKVIKVVVGLCLALSLVGAAYAARNPETGASAADANKVQKYKIVAMDYHFMGLPKKMPAGEKVFNFKNKGEEVHEAVMFKLLHGKTVKQLLKMKPKKAEKHIKEIGAAFAKPGKLAKKPIRADLKKGRYGVLCFVPNAEGAPHFSLGMIHTFRVTG